MSSYSVRDARGGDVDKITAVVGRVLAEAPTYARLTFDHEKTANLIAGCILKQDGWFIRIIVDAFDEPVGGICGVIEQSMFGPDKTATDVTMMIDKEHRGLCVREFTQCCLDYKDWALANGAKIVKLGVSSGIRIDAISVFLERLDFVRIGGMHAYIVGDEQ